MALTKIGTSGIKDDAVTTDKLANAINTERTANTAKDLTALSAANLTSGTIPDARFPATLPAASAANLTAVPAANITGTLPAISATNLTNIPAANITGTLPAISGANLTDLPASGTPTNLIINGAMNVAQRGTSSTSADYQTVDRFKYYQANMDNVAFTQKQVTDSPADFWNSYEIDITTAESALAADEYAQVVQIIEAQNLQHLVYGTSAAKQLTLSFWVKAYQTGTYAINFYVQDANRQITATYTISSSATWEKKTITIAGDTAGSGITNNNGGGIFISWLLAAGSNFTSSNSSSWGGYSDAGYAYGQAVNVLSSTDNYWKLTGVQLELGDSAGDFAYESYGDTLAKCQRYYHTVSQAVWNNQIYQNHYFPTTMRANPSITSTSTGPNIVRKNNWYGKRSTGANTGGISFDWTASAEL